MLGRSQQIRQRAVEVGEAERESFGRQSRGHAPTAIQREFRPNRSGHVYIILPCFFNALQHIGTETGSVGTQIVDFDRLMFRTF